MASSRNRPQYSGKRTGETPRFLSISGYVGGSAGMDVSQPRAVAVSLQIPNGRGAPCFQAEFSGGLYAQFRRQGLIYEDAQFRLDLYADGRMAVVPVDTPDRKIGARIGSLKNLGRLQDKMLKEILGSGRR